MRLLVDRLFQVLLFPLAALALPGLLPIEPSSGQEAREEFFEKKIRPLLVDACLDCHGADTAEGKLRLDSRAGWQRGGERGPAIVPGDPVASLIYQAVKGESGMPRMPPDDYSEPLPASQIADLEQWIRGGAVDPRDGQAVRQIDLQAESHWAFQPIPQSFPDLGPRHPVDFFIDRQLEKTGLITTPPADPRTLTRRATFDLIGLPPTDEQLELGRKDFAALVEQLLQSPHYGERWGRHWLDVARYSDAKDGVLMYGDARIRPFAYTYRDYVIQAFNRDLPFDEFVRHQLAADQLDLPPASPDLAALGFLTLGRMFDLNRHDVIDDQIDVVTRGFLGLTASCARCHDHKFDPIPTADYYSLYGVFASTIEPLDRPRIGEVTAAGQAFEAELKNKLDEINALSQAHYQRTLKTARDKTTEYLVRVATTEPDFAETAVFFKSLVPGHLRPQIVHRWRKLVARRSHANDPLFGPWHDLHQRFERYEAIDPRPESAEDFLQQPANRIADLAEHWLSRGVDPELVAFLQEADPLSPQEIAEAYGRSLEPLNKSLAATAEELAKIDANIRALESTGFNVADIVAGGNGFGTGRKGNGIHPATGKPSQGQAGFIEIPQPDQLVPATEFPLIDGVFVPAGGEATISTTSLKVNDLPATSGKTWDFFKFDVSSGSSQTRIDGIDYSAEPNWVLAMHANKGITFDLQAFRESRPFAAATFRAVLGNSGAAGQSQIDFFVYVDGQRVLEIRDFAAQSPGRKIEIPLTPEHRFLTLVATEGKQGISHDQVILGNPEIAWKNQQVDEPTRQRIVDLRTQRQSLVRQQKAILEKQRSQPLFQLIHSPEGPVWFPEEEVEYYLSRQDRDHFRGLLNQVDAIAVRHAAAADRAMVLHDRNQLFDPVIFQRGDPGQKGTPVPRQTLSLLEPEAAPFQNGSGRLELAESIVAEDNPLTARVWVNRVWMHHFGEPLVATPSDFGLQAERPPQLELLDYLASYLIEQGWRTKPLHRLIMSSRTYQRSSQVPDAAVFREQLSRDPENQYFWKGNRRRLDLEQMRDAMLFVSGQLDTRMYGRPQLITDPNNRRRTVYAFVERQNLPEIIQSFDAANADTSTARRPETIVPQQALFAMNAPFVLRQAEALAKSLEQLPDDDERIKGLFRKLFHREPMATEREAIRPELTRIGLQQLAHVLLITNEFMYID